MAGSDIARRLYELQQEQMRQRQADARGPALVDPNDERDKSAFMFPPEPKVEVLDRTTGKFEPDYSPDAEKRLESQNAAEKEKQARAAIEFRTRVANDAKPIADRQRGKEAWAAGGPPSEDAPVPDLASMSPSDAKRLRSRYEGSGHTQTMTYEDWLSANFAGSTPGEVVASARATPRIQAGQDPNLLPGEKSGLAGSRQAAGKPLPEGRDISQYTPEQRRKMSRNVHSPEVPMDRFGGTSTYNVDGSTSSRAPNPEMLSLASDIAADPEQGANSASHTMALAQAYGIDATQYGDDMDLLKADVAREQKRHASMEGKYTIEANPMGGFVYVPSEKTRTAMEERRRNKFADEVYARHKGLVDESGKPLVTFEEINAAAKTPEGMQQLRNIDRAARRFDAGLRQQNVRNNWANINMVRMANNPRVAQGAYMRSLQQAAQTGDPMQVAAVHSSFGNERAAHDYLALAASQSDAAGKAAAAEAEATGRAGGPQGNVPYAQQFQREIGSALSIGDPAQRRAAVIGILTKMGTVPPEKIEQTADVIIQSSAGGVAPPQQSGGWAQWAGDLAGDIWNSLSSAPASAWAGAPGAPEPQATTAQQEMDAMLSQPLFVPGGNQSPYPRR
jgi:hypothetical protein